MYQYQCPKCGQTFTLDRASNLVHCPMCGAEFAATIPQEQPPRFGNQPGGPAPQQPGQQQYYQPQYAYQPAGPGVFDNGPSGKSRGVAGLLAILLGAFGIHYFYLGKTGAGLITLALGLVSCGIWGILMLIQGVLMLTMTQEEFERKYVYSNSTLPLF